jgi:hypothetical protein
LKCLIFDPFCGASEPMILGALLACGADEWRVKAAVEGLCGLPMHIAEEKKGGIVAKVAIINEMMAKGWPVYLTADEALNKLNIMQEKEPVRTDAMAIARAILEAKDAVHGSGSGISLGSIAMIAGICAAIDSLGRPEVRCTPVAMGGGIVDTRCGPTPVPLPETMGILKGSGLIVQGGPFDGELLTVEAAAVLAYFSRQSCRYYPENMIIATGYGFGKHELPMPDVLRISYCEIDDALISDRIELLETNVDDVTGEVLGNLIEELFSMGARDVSIIPAMMKKGRSGQLIRVISKAEDSPALSRRIMLETGSLGVRVIPVKHRHIAKRDIYVVNVRFEDNDYDMRFKVATDTAGNILDVSVEYEDARLVSKDLAMPLKTVMRKAETEAWKRFENKK